MCLEGFRIIRTRTIRLVRFANVAYTYVRPDRTRRLGRELARGNVENVFDPENDRRRKYASVARLHRPPPTSSSLDETADAVRSVSRVPDARATICCAVCVDENP